MQIVHCALFTLLWTISMELRFGPIWLAADRPMIFGMKTCFQREHNSEYWPLQLLERSIWKMVLITFSTPSVGTYNLWLSMGVPEDLKQFKKRSHGLVWPILWRWDWEQYKQHYLQASSLLTQWVVFCMLHYFMQSAMMAYIWFAMHFRLFSYVYKYWTTLQWWPVCSQLLESI